MKTGIANISVQNSFCNDCSEKIKAELLGITDITNIYLYPNDSLIVFNFKKANELSVALNTLTALGYPPKGDTIDPKNDVRPLCCCVKSAPYSSNFNKSNMAFHITKEQTDQQLDKAS